MTLAVLAGEQETECRKIVREVLLLDPRAALTSQNRTPRQFHLPRSDEKLIEAIMQLSTGPTESRLSKVLTFELLAKIDHSSRKHEHSLAAIVQGLRILRGSRHMRLHHFPDKDAVL